MLYYILRRSIAMAFILLGIVTMAFLLTAVTKGDPLTAVVSEQQMNNPEIVAAAKKRWGLDRSLPERYVIYVGNLLRGDMGTSFVTRRPVSTDLMARLPATFELVICAMVIGSVIGIVFGLLAAYYHDTAIDQAARLFALFGSSVPIFWLGLAALFFFSVHYQILPGPGRIDPRMAQPPTVTGFMTIDSLLAGDLKAFKDALAHLVLPSLAVGLGWVGYLARMVRAYALPAMENVALWHERDISHSSVERMIGPDATVTLDFALNRLTGIIDKLLVYPETMKRNLETLGGLPHSERVLLALVNKGLTREAGYKLVQRNAMKAWHGEGDFAALLKADADVTAKLSNAEIDSIFDLGHHLRHVDTIFDRVFGKQ